MMPLDPTVGGTVLRIPAVQSPNFSMANQTGWQLTQAGQATFFSVTLQGGNVVIFGPNGSVLIYSGVPAAGNLIIAIAGQAGTDSFGNSWVEGEQIGIAGQGQLIFQPNVGQAVMVGTAAGTIQGSVQGVTTDVNQAQPSLFGPVLLNPGSSQIMAQISTSPLLATGGMGIILQSAADDASTAAKISLCSVSLQGQNMTLTSMIDVTPNGLTINATQGGGLVQVVLTTSQTWTSPSNVPATIQVECFGATGGSGSGAQSEKAGGGAGGGEYAAEPALAVTPATGYTAVVATGGSAGTSGGNGSIASGNTTFAGDSHTVTAHPGGVGAGGSSTFGGTGGPGGTGSTNTTHHDGGGGGFGGNSGGFGAPGAGGGGGGASGSAAGAGGAGSTGSSSVGGSGGAGGAAASGGQNGGAGGAGGAPASNGGSARTPGGAPGGGGAGNNVSGSGGSGAVGAKGQIRLTYTPTGSTAQSVTVSLSSTGQLSYTNPAGLVVNLSGTQPSPTSKVIVSNSTTETVMGILTIPGNDAQPGAIYEMDVFGIYSTAATNIVLTWAAKLGGTAGTSLIPAFAPTLTASQTGLNWQARITVSFYSTTEAVAQMFLIISATSATTAAPVYIRSSDTTGLTTTGSEDLVLTAKWTTASTSNVLTAYSTVARRMA